MSKKASKQRATLYARVSTGEERQDPETQVAVLREYGDQREFEVAREYVDTGSRRDEDRPEYQRFLRDARRLLFVCAPADDRPATDPGAALVLGVLLALAGGAPLPSHPAN